MGGLAFGWDDSIDCITPVKLKGDDGAALCLAHKTSKLFVGAGVWVRDDGYVLRREGDAHVFYPWPDAATVKAWQSEQLLPDPLPSYSVSIADYLVGYSLWIILIAMLVVSQVKRVLTRRRQAQDALTPVSFGPPKQDTEQDRFIAQTVGALLEPGETLQHQAVATPGADDRINVWFAALTSHRLVLVRTERTPFKPALTNKGVEFINRSQVTGATEMNWEITFTLEGGNTFVLCVPPKETGFSNQRAFIRDVPRILSGTQVVTSGVQVLG